MANEKKNFLDQFKGLFQKNKFEKELKEVLASVEVNPHDLRLKIRLAEIYFRMKDIPKGIEVYREVAEAYTQEGFYLKAVAIYKNMIRMSPGTVEFNEKLAELCKQLGMTQDAINQYLIVIHYYQNHGQKEKVLEVAQHMVDTDPQSVPCRMRLAEIYFNQGLQSEALKEYELIGNQLKEEGGKQLSLLIEVLEKVFFRRPQDKNLLKELCILYLKNHNPAAVIKKLRNISWKKKETFRKFMKRQRKWLLMIIKNRKKRKWLRCLQKILKKKKTLKVKVVYENYLSQRNARCRSSGNSSLASCGKSCPRSF